MSCSINHLCESFRELLLRVVLITVFGSRFVGRFCELFLFRLNFLRDLQRRARRFGQNGVVAKKQHDFQKRGFLEYFARILRAQCLFFDILFIADCWNLKI